MESRDSDNSQEWEDSPTNRNAAETSELPVPEHRPALVALVGSVAGRSYVMEDDFVVGRAPEALVKLSASDVSLR